MSIQKLYRKESDDDDDDTDDGIEDDGDDNDDEDGEAEKDEGVEEVETPEYPNMPLLSHLKADFQLLDYSDFTTFLTSVYCINKSIGEEFSCEGIKDHVLEKGALKSVGRGTESEFVRDARDLCKISYIEHMISRQMEYIDSVESESEFVIMSKEYFLFMFNLTSGYYDRTEDKNYYETFIEGKIYGLPIVISKHSISPLVVHKLSKSDPGKDIQDCYLLPKKKLIEYYPDVFTEKGKIKKEATKAEDLIQNS